jgi:hypothetical protein
MGTNGRPGYVGWQRSIAREARWQEACEADTAQLCLDRVLRVVPPLPGRAVLRVVLPAGQHPQQALRVPRQPKELLGDRRAARKGKFTRETYSRL